MESLFFFKGVDHWNVFVCLSGDFAVGLTWKGFGIIFEVLKVEIAELTMWIIGKQKARGCNPTRNNNII